MYLPILQISEESDHHLRCRRRTRADMAKFCLYCVEVQQCLCGMFARTITLDDYDTSFILDRVDLIRSRSLHLR